MAAVATRSRASSAVSHAEPQAEAHGHPCQAHAPADSSGQAGSASDASRESSQEPQTATSTAATTPSACSAEFSPKVQLAALPAHQPALLAALPGASDPSGPSPSAWSLREEHPVSTAGEGEVLIRTNHVGLNPFDWQAVDYKFGVGKEPKVMGRDGSGVVVQVGDNVDRFKVGDRVWFCSNSGRPGAAAFQDYSVHSANELALTPDNITDIEAATLGTGIVTAGVALFRTLELELELLTQASELDHAAKPWMLVWGGAGSTGVFLIQLARLAGFRVICAASPVNQEYVKSLGADVVLDRWQTAEELVDQIRAATADNVLLAVDNVGPKTAALCAQVVAGSASWREKNGVPPSSEPAPPARLLAIAGSPKAPAATGPTDPGATPDAVRDVDQPRLSFSTTFYGHHNFSAPFLDAITAALAAGAIRPGRLRLIEGGLDGIEAGLGEMKRGAGVSGFKLVARLSGAEPVAEVKGAAKRGVEEEEAAAAVAVARAGQGEAKKRKVGAAGEVVTKAEVDAVTYRM